MTMMAWLFLIVPGDDSDAGDGDDEIMVLNLQAIPFDVMKVSFVLSIYADETKNHDFSMVKNVYFRIVNNSNQHELLRYELDDELSGEEGLIIAELERIGTDWVFHAVGDTVKGGLGIIAENYGIVVAEHVRG